MNFVVNEKTLITEYTPTKKYLELKDDKYELFIGKIDNKRIQGFMRTTDNKIYNLQPLKPITDHKNLTDLEIINLYYGLFEDKKLDLDVMREAVINVLDEEETQYEQAIMLQKRLER